jgi:hypothetical protein
VSTGDAILAIDRGPSSTKALDADGEPVTIATDA